MKVRRIGVRGWVSFREVNGEGWSYVGCWFLRDVKNGGFEFLLEII